ncbi:hypothetical protein N9N67_10285, partial [Bacteriovoracaceae bacterium]|nr:hypothetical protein [Bacteriovoracaceae bacterium]
SELEKKSIHTDDLDKIKKSATDNLVPVVRNSGDPHYYYSTTMVDKKGLEIHLFEENKNKFFSRFKFFLDKPSSEDVLSKSKLTSVIYEDMNGDGKKDFLFFSLHTEENKKNRSKSELYWQYTYLNHELKPLFPKKSFFKYVPPRSTFPNEFQTELEDLIFTIPRKIEDLSFVQQEVKGLGMISFPIFFQANSFVPYYQQANTPFDRIKVDASDQIFYLKLENKDGEDFLVTYALLTDKFHKELTGLRNNLKPIEVVGPIRNNEKCLNEKAVCFYLIHGNSFYRKMSLLKILPDLALETEFVAMDLEGISRFTKGQSFSLGEPRYYGHRYIEIQEGKKSLLLASGEKGLKELSFTASTQGRTKLKTFENNNLVSRLELDGNYIYHINQNLENKAKWKNYSFLGLQEQTELYEPVFLKKRTSFFPAILWDAQFLTENSLKVSYFKNNRVITPLKYAVKIPSNCKRLSSRYNNGKGNYEIPLLCTTKDQKEGSLFLMDLKI